MTNEIKLYAQHYFDLGLNTTCIVPYKSVGNFKEKNILKSPSGKWDHLSSQRQTLTEFDSYDWENAIGTGIILGFEDIIAIDIDGCVDFELVEAILCELKLPYNYEWLIESGSNVGYHIIFKCSRPPDLVQKMRETLIKPDPFGKESANSYYPNPGIERYIFHIKKDGDENFIDIDFEERWGFPFIKKGQLVKNRPEENDLSVKRLPDLFRKMEFLWSAHIVLPTTIHQSGQKYKFKNNIPSGLPAQIKYSDLVNVYRIFCDGLAPVSWRDIKLYAGSLSTGLDDGFQEIMHPPLSYLQYPTIVKLTI